MPTNHAMTYVICAGHKHGSCYVNNRVRLSVVDIRLTNPNNHHRTDIYALLATACDTTVISEALAKELGYAGVQVSIYIKGVNAVRSSYAQYVEITVHGIDETLDPRLDKVTAFEQA